MARFYLNASPPDRSSIKSRVPNEDGTAFVECAASYIAMLAHAHNVRKNSMISYLSGSHHLANGSSSAMANFNSDTPRLVNLDLLTRISKENGVASVRRLGLAHMSGALSNGGTIKKFFSWCPECLVEMAEKPSSSHGIPLIWCIASASCCLTHLVDLVDVCSYCKSRNYFYKSVEFPFDVCKLCGHNLVGKARAKASDNLSFQTTANIGELILAIQTTCAEIAPQKPNLRLIIESARSRNLIDGTIDLVKRSGISKGTLSHILNGGSAGLHIWSDIALISNLSLAGIFFKDAWTARTEILSPKDLKVGGFRRRATRDWSAIENEAEVTISSFPVSVGIFASRFGADCKNVKRRLGETAGRLTAASDERKAAQKASDFADLVEAVKQVLEEERPTGIRRPAGRAVAKAVGRSHSNAAFALAYKLARKACSDAA